MVSQSYGSPVDRVGEMARWAVASFTKTPLSSIWKPHSAYSTSSTAPPSSLIKSYFSSLFTYIRFNAALFVVSLGFAATKTWAWIQANVLRRDKVRNYEDLLEDQAKAMMEEFGMLIAEDAFDG